MKGRDHSMKLSVEVYELIKKFGDYKAAELVKEAGFDAIDYSYYWDNENERVLGDGYREYAENLKRHLDKIGIVCNQAHAPFSLEYGCVFDISEQKYLWLLHSIESAAILGAKNIIVHSVSVPKGVDFEEYNLNYYRSLIPYCEKFGICVSVENLFSYDSKRHHLTGKLGSPEEICRIVKKLDSPWINICVDIGHASLTGYEPEEFIEKIDPKFLKALHVQDNDYIEDRHILPYTGELNWKAIMTSLKKIGYDGDLTFEIFAYLGKIPDDLIPDALKFAVSVGKYLISNFHKDVR